MLFYKSNVHGNMLKTEFREIIILNVLGQVTI